MDRQTGGMSRRKVDLTPGSLRVFWPPSVRRQLEASAPGAPCPPRPQEDEDTLLRTRGERERGRGGEEKERQGVSECI